MIELSEQLSKILKNAFIDCGYGENAGNVVPCVVEGFGDFQCNDSMRLAKEFRKNPFDIANEVTEKIKSNHIASPNLQTWPWNKSTTYQGDLIWRLSLQC